MKQPFPMHCAQVSLTFKPHVYTDVNTAYHWSQQTLIDITTWHVC